MSIRKTTKKANGREYESWMIDFRYTDQDGKRKRFRKSGFRTKRAAKKAQTRIESAIDDGSFFEPDEPDEQQEDAPTLNEFADRYIEDCKGRLKLSTWEGYEQRLESHVLPVLGEMRLDAVKRADVDALVSDLAIKGLSNKTIKNVMGVLSGRYRTAVEWDVVGAMPAIEAPKAGDPEWYYLEKREADALVKAAQEEPRISMMVRMALHTGMRLGELLGLRRRDIDFGRCQIHVQKSYSRGKLTTPKSHKRRSIPITETFCESLRSYIAERPRSEWVFCDDEGGILNKQRVRDPLDRAYKAAEIPTHKRGWHLLRHTYATQMAGSGAVTLRDLQKLLGHGTIEVTERYAHFMPEAYDRAREALAGVGLGE